MNARTPEVIITESTLKEDLGLYELRTEKWRQEGVSTAVKPIQIAYSKRGEVVGSWKLARMLQARGIDAMKAWPGDTRASIGFCAADGKWYAWGYEGAELRGFGPGDVAQPGHLATMSKWPDSTLAERPELDRRVPVGFVAHTLDDAKRLAIAYADAVA